ncbi:MAG: vitamin K epoxide reductase family protein [Prochlorococcaceae cyanobacterium]
MTSSRLSERLSTSRRRDAPGRRWFQVAIAVLATVGVIDTGSITLQRWGLLGPLVCPGGSGGCEKVLTSPWGTLLGQPLSLFGLVAYATVLVLALLPLLLRGDARQAVLAPSRWGLFLGGTGLMVFSLVLMGLLIVRIKAFCFFCVLSALLSTGIFVLSLLAHDWQDRGRLVFRGILVALAVLVFGLGWSTMAGQPVQRLAAGTPPAVTSTSSPEAIALAEHLTRSGAVIYTAYWCPHCHEQKELFGKQATAKLTVIECAPDGVNSQKALCDSKKLEGFPTWDINGTLDSGVKPLARLAELSGYRGALPR